MKYIYDIKKMRGKLLKLNLPESYVCNNTGISITKLDAFLQGKDSLKEDDLYCLSLFLRRH